MKKTTEKESLVSQIKAIPNQVKVFILGLFVVVLALASVLPNLNSKSLQGSVLNIKMSSKVDGYWYSYQPLENCFLIESNNEVKISCSKQESNICQIPENVLACDLMLDTCPSQCRPVQCRTPENVLACSLELESCPTECRYGWNNWTGNICQLPENVLACSLMIDTCPMQCRPAVCQTPESVLACSLGLSSCPNGCVYLPWNSVIRDVAITKATFAAANNKEAKVTVEVENIWNVDMNLNGIGHDFYVWDGYGYGTQQDHWPMSIEVVDHFVPTLSPWQKDQFVIYVKTKDIPFSKNSYVFLNVISNGDQNVQNNNTKVRIEWNIRPDLWDIIDRDSREVVTQEVSEKPVVAEELEKPTEVIETVEAVETPIVAEATEEITKERSDSLLDMVKNIFK
jgi:hypothetical protein